MELKDMLHHVDHTLLKAAASWDEIMQLCNEAIEYQTASVCVPASYVKRIHEKYGNKLPICTVIGFPLGYSTTANKVTEAKQALDEGASEIDMVINIGDVKNNEFDKVTAEIAALKKTAGSKILKVIVETCYLTEAEKVKLCKCVTDGGADYIKTSTGFGTAGAKIEDVRLFKKYIGHNVKIKAAGGIHTIKDMKMFLEAGCDRLGMSAAIELANEEEKQKGSNLL